MFLERDDRTGMTLYVDPDTIRRKGDRVTMWSLYDYKTVQTMEGDSFLSRKVEGEYDCTEEIRRMIGVTVFSGNMGSGKVVYMMNSSIDSTSKRWAPVRSTGVAARSQWEIACNKK